MDISFKLGERKHTDVLFKFFSQSPLNYKGFNIWLPRAIEEYHYEIKRAILGFYEDILVSALMFQDCKHIKGLTELKIARTIEEFSNRLFLSFETRQVEALAKEEKNLGMICDVRANRLDVLNLYKSMGYREVARTDLYNEGYEDVVLMKPLVDRELF